MRGRELRAGVLEVGAVSEKEGKESVGVAGAELSNSDFFNAKTPSHGKWVPSKEGPMKSSFGLRKKKKKKKIKRWRYDEYSVRYVV
jgi:hypothetical protein